MEGVEEAPLVNASLVEADNASNLTGREAASLQGIVVTYSALFAMALGPILLGSLRSVPYHSAMRVGEVVAEATNHQGFNMNLEGM